MSRVEPRIRRFSRVIWTERVDDMVLLFSGIVMSEVAPGDSHIYVTNIRLHSLESESGITGKLLGEVRSQGPVLLADAKSIDDLRYKK